MGKGARRPPAGDGEEATAVADPPRQLGLFDLLRPDLLRSWIEPVRKLRDPGRRRAGSGAAPSSPVSSPSAAASSPPSPPSRPQADDAAPRRRPRLRTRGRCCDLEVLLDELNQRFFGGELTAAITWGRRRPQRRHRRRRSGRISMQLGSYHPDQDLIRIHPALDRPWVPRYVLESIIHHELLHAAMPPTTENGRRRLHTPEFRRRERQYPQHRRAQEWIRDNLRRLIEDA